MQIPQEESRFTNSHLIIDNTGQIVAKYDKIHMFDIDVNEKTKFKESEVAKPGEKIVAPVESPIGKLGLSICYDIRFPELYRKMTLAGAEILLTPAAFFIRTGMAHWEPILKARAIENQCYVIAAGQWGIHNSVRESYGHSMVIDPWGTIIAQAGDREELIFAEIDLNYLYEVRQKLPSLKNRREDMYPFA